MQDLLWLVIGKKIEEKFGHGITLTNMKLKKLWK